MVKHESTANAATFIKKIETSLNTSRSIWCLRWSGDVQRQSHCHWRKGKLV